MRSTAGLEIMNSTSPEINWKNVTKGKRSRKSVARSLNGVAKAGNSSPKRVGDFSGSDSDKVGKTVLEKSTSGKAKRGLIKKRRRVFGSSSPQRSAPLRPRDSFSPCLQATSSPSKDQDQLPHPSRSSGRGLLSANSNLQSRGMDCTTNGKVGNRWNNEALSKQAEGKYFDPVDFSGIELLVNAASMADADNANKDVSIVGNSSMPKSADTSTATLSKLDVEYKKSENAPSCAAVYAEKAESSLVQNKCAALVSPRGSVKDESAQECVSMKVDRRHWDLNVLPDAWDEPYDESMARNTSEGASDYDVHIKGSEERLEDNVLSNLGATGVEYCIPKIEEDKLKEALLYQDNNELPSAMELLPTKTKSSSNPSTEDFSANHLNQVSSGGPNMQTSSPVTKKDAIADSFSVRLSCSSSMIVSNGENRVSRDIVVMQDEDSRKSSEPPGTSDQDVQFVVDRNVRPHVSGSRIIDCHEQSKQDEIVPKHEDNNLTDEGSQRIIMGDSCKSSSSGVQGNDPTSSVGKVDSTVDAQNDSDASQDNQGNIAGGDDQSRIQEQYDSPSEDGELRGSYCYSWVGNELELDCVDYESDGRNGGGSEGRHCAERRGLLTKRYPDELVIKSGSIKHSVRGKDDSMSNEMKESNGGGSGTTVEQSMEIIVEEDGMKREPFSQTNATVGGETLASEYITRMARPKLPSRAEGWSFVDSTDGKNVSFIEQCRSRRPGGLYSRERNFGPGNNMGSYRPATHVREKEGVDEWTRWGSRNRYTSGLDGRNQSRPRSLIGDSAERFEEFDFNDPRQMGNYQSKGYKPLVRRRSPMDRDDCFGMHRRMPVTQGISSDRNRRQYPQVHNRDYGDDFQSAPDAAAAASIRVPRYFSKAERGFSPNYVRGAHMPSTQRRSRSRSRTRSPKAWHSQRERNFSGRRHSKSPDFRSEFRTERVRMPFSKPAFAHDYSEAYMSPPPRAARFSPHRGGRFVDNRNFADNNPMHRKSPVRVNRRNHRFDDVDSSGQFQSDDYFRPMVRPKRFSFMAKEGRECKFQADFEDRKREDRGEMMHRRRQTADCGNIRRVQRDMGDDFEMGCNIRRVHRDVGDNLEMSSRNNEDDVCGTVSRVQSDREGDQSDREDNKRALQV